jgi:hypothetical protein
MGVGSLRGFLIDMAWWEKIGFPTDFAKSGKNQTTPTLVSLNFDSSYKDI